ncbi:MAG TPA: hypothetical protein P5555_18905 [Candidatus Paceibacterota bacterium]|nr:hypothetical protein [Verrucomicrobiota bacterium]HRZ47254.1 hypothetical protein [Candidatus Paceibacterota bacterium]HRZ91578.1 hypothetical protein [Candidatus Paceibacterota bacterium]
MKNVMNAAQRILDWVWAAVPLAGLVFLMLTAKLKGRGLLTVSLALSTLVSAGLRVFPLFLI